MAKAFVTGLHSKGVLVAYGVSDIVGGLEVQHARFAISETITERDAYKLAGDFCRTWNGQPAPVQPAPAPAMTVTFERDRAGVASFAIHDGTSARCRATGQVSDGKRSYTFDAYEDKLGSHDVALWVRAGCAFRMATETELPTFRAAVLEAFVAERKIERKANYDRVQAIRAKLIAAGWSEDFAGWFVKGAHRVGTWQEAIKIEESTKVEPVKVGPIARTVTLYIEIDCHVNAYGLADAMAVQAMKGRRGLSDVYRVNIARRARQAELRDMRAMAECLSLADRKKLPEALRPTYRFKGV